MNITNLKLKDALLIEQNFYPDMRGCFSEDYNKKKFSKIIGKEVNFVQDNYSLSNKNVLRGLHFQKNPKAQAKLIKVLQGEIFDVIVDIRKSSKTFMQWEGIYLSSKDRKQIWIPEGFAHGFLALTDSTEVAYKVTNYYDPKFECIIRYDDPELDIKWPVRSKYNVSEKDTNGIFSSEIISFE